MKSKISFFINFFIYIFVACFTDIKIHKGMYGCKVYFLYQSVSGLTLNNQKQVSNALPKASDFLF
jgi:hypothetical protein